MFLMLSSLADEILVVVKVNWNQALSTKHVLPPRQQHSNHTCFGFASVHVTMQRTSPVM